METVTITETHTTTNNPTPEGGMETTETHTVEAPAPVEVPVVEVAESVAETVAETITDAIEETILDEQWLNSKFAAIETAIQNLSQLETGTQSLLTQMQQTLATLQQTLTEMLSKNLTPPSSPENPTITETVTVNPPAENAEGQREVEKEQRKSKRIKI